ncbi:MAG: amidohydrolase family protein [Pirellulaceae bacterium]|nr:amidohydrolase family protein [Pirellulaceae bacterium]
MRIDSHHHFWKYDAREYAWINDSMSVLKRDFGPAELLPLCQAAGVDGVVSVQASQSLLETERLIRFAESETLVRGVVGWVPLASNGVGTELEKLAMSPWLKGVRHVVQDETDPEFLMGTAFNAGIRRLREFKLTYDLLIYPWQLPATIKFVDMHPEQPFVLDHIAKPAIDSSKYDADWEKHLRELAKRPQVIGCKFSGIVTEVRDDQWSVNLLRPYWDVALEAFGAERLMFGSDWPVILLRSEYSRWVSAVVELTSKLSSAQQAAFWSENVSRVYGLSK